jgi:hypothetical protein
LKVEFIWTTPVIIFSLVFLTADVLIFANINFNF